MPKIKIFTAKNVQQYGFTDKEINALNAEWELKASELGLEEHFPEYWQEAKQHMSQKLEGKTFESREEVGMRQSGGESLELPSLDVDFNDFEIAGEDEITEALSDDALIEEAFAELPELESISVDDLDLEIIPEEQEILVEEIAEVEKADEVPAPVEVEEPEMAIEEPTQEEIIPVEEIAEVENADEEPAPVQVEEQEMAVEEKTVEEAIKEKVVPVGAPDLHSAEISLESETATPELVGEGVAEEGVTAKEVTPVEEQKKESFFGKIIARLKKIF